MIPSWYPPDGGRIFEDYAKLLPSEQMGIKVLVNRIIGLSSKKFHDIITAGRKGQGIENSVSVTRSSMLKIPWTERINTERWIRKTLKLFEFHLQMNPLPDLIIAMSSLWAGAVARNIKMKYSIPYLVVEHRGRFTALNEYAFSYLMDWYRDVFNPVFKDAERVICVSEALRAGIIKLTGIEREKFEIIPNMIDPEFFDFPDHERGLQPFIFLSLGRLEKIKGYDVLLTAFAEFTDLMDGEFFLRIGGKGNEEKVLKNLTRDLGIQDRVSFMGTISRERVRDEMHRANVFVSTSFFESFGMAIAEAVMTGLPVIATNSGGAESIVNSTNGIIVQSGNSHELAEAMVKIYSGYLKYEQEPIRRQAVTLFGTTGIIQQYHRIIMDILNETQDSAHEPEGF
jgi:glycosyltransferase involved in cell wall biosynthesis